MGVEDLFNQVRVSFEELGGCDDERQVELLGGPEIFFFGDELGVVFDDQA